MHVLWENTKKFPQSEIKYKSILVGKCVFLLQRISKKLFEDLLYVGLQILCMYACAREREDNNKSFITKTSSENKKQHRQQFRSLTDDATEQD